MLTYKHVLLATSLSPNSYPLAVHAIRLAQDFGARLSLLHVIERPLSQNNTEITANDMKRMKAAREQLLKLGKELIVPEFDQRAVIGDAKTSILSVANDLSIDLIVIGQNEHTESSVGSTALAVLKKAVCDVITIRGNP